MRARLALATLGAVLVLTAAGDRAFAEHEVYYRYTVLGYVKDAKGRPVAATRVELVRDKTGLSYDVDTDERGLYVLVVRLGDESAGESLTLSTGKVRTRLTVRFDAGNHQDERGTRVDLEGARWLERSAWFRSTLARVLAPPTR